MYKFFVKNNQIKDKKITIVGEDVNHIKNVLRLQKNDKIQVCNCDTSNTYNANITKIENDSIIVEILNQCIIQTEPSIYIHIFQGLPKQEKMEWIIQKATELGVSEITPIKMDNCVVKLDEKNQPKKIKRWQTIAEVAAKQSKRDKIPIINSVLNIKNMYKNLIGYDIVLLAYEEEKCQTVKQVIKQIPKRENIKIAVIIGPEGGITKKEINILEEIPNLKIVTLGNRILRTETAPIVLASILMYEYDEMK